MADRESRLGPIKTSPILCVGIKLLSSQQRRQKLNMNYKCTIQHAPYRCTENLSTTCATPRLKPGACSARLQEKQTGLVESFRSVQNLSTAMI